MDGGKKVWVPHPTDGFKLGRITDIGSDSISIEPFDAPGTVSLACKASHQLSFVKSFCLTCWITYNHVKIDMIYHVYRLLFQAYRMLYWTVGEEKLMFKPMYLSSQTINAIYDRTFPAEEYDNKDCEDNCK